MVDVCKLANGTYDLSQASGGLINLIQAINCWANGYFGATVLIVFSIVLFSVIAFFGDVKGSWYSTCFIALIISYGFVTLEILATPFLLVILVLNIVNLILAITNQ